MLDLTRDRAALDAYRRGDRATCGLLFEAHAERVARWASCGFGFTSGGERHRFAGLSSAVDVHDVVNEVFKAAFEPRARAQYSGLAPFEAYLFAITKSAVLRRLRHERRERPVDAESLESLEHEAESAEERLAREEEITMVREFLSTLSPEERSFAELRFAEQKPQDEVGGALRWTRKKVRLQEESIRQGLARFLLRRRGTKELAG